MFDLTSVFWLMAIGLIIYYWIHSLQVKEIAYAAARRHCQEMQVQMLDQNVYLRRLWFKRAEKGGFYFWRAFYFEFTVSGQDRYTGRVLMLSSRVSTVQLEPHRVC